VFDVARGARKTRKMRKTCHFGQNQGVTLSGGSPFKFTVAKRCFGKKVHKIQLDMGPFCEKNDLEHISAKNGPFCVFSERKKSTIAKL
jgi:hypothetical protein